MTIWDVVHSNIMAETIFTSADAALVRKPCIHRRDETPRPRCKACVKFSMLTLGVFGLRSLVGCGSAVLCRPWRSLVWHRLVTMAVATVFRFLNTFDPVPKFLRRMEKAEVSRKLMQYGERITR